MVERKGFNFYRSYWEQMKLLNEKQKVQILEAICKVQFLEVNINDIYFTDKMTALVWAGVKHSISTSLNGFISKNKGLDKDVILPLSKGGDQQVQVKEQVQVQVKEKEQEEGENLKIDFNIFWNLYDKKTGNKTKLIKKWDSLSLETQNLILEYIPKYKVSQPDKKFRKNPETFFNGSSWNDEIINSNQNTNATKTRIDYDADKF